MADDHQAPGGATPWKHRVSRASLAETRVAALDGVVLAIASVVSYLLVTKILSRVYSHTIIGVAIGVAAAWLGLRLAGPRAEENR